MMYFSERATEPFSQQDNPVVLARSFFIHIFLFIIT
nr:MAG TPA: hypothetical protein [Caudoviricetes sp.]